MKVKAIFLFTLIILCSWNAWSQPSSFEFPLHIPNGQSKFYLTHDRGNVKITGHNRPVFILKVESNSKTPLVVAEDSIVNGRPKLITISNDLRMTFDNNGLHMKSLMNGQSLKIYNIEVLVPYSCLLNVNVNQLGDINIDHVKSTANIRNSVGGITVTRLSGAIIASAPNGKIDISFEEVSGIRGSSIAGLNKDIQVRFPSAAHVGLKIKCPNGKINSEIKLEPEDVLKKDKKEIKYDSWMSGKLNKGTTEIMIQSRYGTININLNPI